MVLTGVPAPLAVQSMVSAAEAAAILVGIEVGSVLHLDLVADLVVDNVPVLALDMVVYILVVRPVDVVVLLLPLLSDPLKVLEGVACSILVERLSLRKLLKHLVSRGELAIALDVEAQFRLEAWGRNDLDASVLMRLLTVVELLNVVHWVLEFFLSGPKNRHFVNFIELVVNVFGLDEGVFQHLIDQFLFLFGHLAVHVAIVTLPFLPLAGRFDRGGFSGERLTVLLPERCGSSLS